jgi:hypothetical protein
MEDNSDVDSDGSDIDIGNFDENYDANDDFELREVNRNADEWLEAMFDSDSDNDMEFEGFQEESLDRLFPYLGTKYTIILTYNTAQGCVYTTTSKTTTVVHVVFRIKW